MTKLLLSIHVLVAIIAIGPVTVAASMFPAATRRASAEPTDPRGVAVLHNLHRICRVYATLGVLVPVFGLATASSLGVLGDAWLIISIILTAAAAAMLIFFVLPGQAAVLRSLPIAPPVVAHASPLVSAPDFSPAAAPPSPPTSAPVPSPASAPAAPSANAVEAAPQAAGETTGRRLAAWLGMVTGIFNLLWAMVVVLMIVRPGSTTGV
ncbi:hypothetical protein ACQP2Y_41190 [Actinoplanes sp. CA-051413]|uniref:hypothetical protein n=1 Tax=Actinoplanes sp. CA-051413 TaxID=3239899 RepID=UPI003D97D057